MIPILPINDILYRSKMSNYMERENSTPLC